MNVRVCVYIYVLARTIYDIIYIPPYYMNRILMV